MAAIPRISIIIPVYRESGEINDLLAHLRRLDPQGQSEIIVVDGHPDRDTNAAIRTSGVTTLGSSKGRARQMNAGAGVARGSILLFLHADTYLPENALARITSTLADKQLVGGAFDLAFATRSRVARLFARLESLRARVSRIPFGDHAIFLRKTEFDSIGGFADIPIMEDVDIMRRIRRRRERIVILDDHVTTSARRLHNEGLFYCVLRGGFLMLLFSLGVPPKRLERFYKECSGRDVAPQAPGRGRHGARSGSRLVASEKR
jgi:rSAM/selenodomain-associated transferase 2